MAKLNKQEQIKRLKKHLANLKAGGSISKRDMTALLSDEQIQQYEDEWQNAQDYKQTIIDGRWELESYTKMLKIGDLIWSRFENTKTGNHKADTEYAAQSAYETSLEHLQELLDRNPAIEIYLNRPVSFMHDHEPDISAGEVPRYMLSKSHHAIAPQFDTQRDIKMSVIESAIEDLSQTKKKSHATKKPAAVSQTLAKLRKYRPGP